jgi:hypothetical protein
MIHSVFSTTADAASQWQSELLEYSWRRIKQPGELVRLVAVDSSAALPCHRKARVLATLSWSPHPYIDDRFPPYNRAGSILEWLFRERVDGTVLLVDPDCVFRAPIEVELAPGQALATPWPQLQLGGDGPFALPSESAFLHRFCVDRSLPIPRVTLPLLIHSRDLRRIAARWLELTSIIRAELSPEASDLRVQADRLAYAIAAAEAEIPHHTADLAVDTSTEDNGAPIIHYRSAVESARGEIVWDKQTYVAWDRPASARARSGPGRDLLVLLEEFVRRREAGGDLALLRPRRRKGVREGRVLDRVTLQIPSRSDSLALNPSAAAIWDLCDGRRSLDDIVRELHLRFGASPEALRNHVESTADQLQTAGALDLEQEPI